MFHISNKGNNAYIIKEKFSFSATQYVYVDLVLWSLYCQIISADALQSPSSHWIVVWAAYWTYPNILTLVYVCGCCWCHIVWFLALMSSVMWYNLHELALCGVCIQIHYPYRILPVALKVTTRIALEKGYYLRIHVILKYRDVRRQERDCTTRVTRWFSYDTSRECILNYFRLHTHNGCI